MYIKIVRVRYYSIQLAMFLVVNGCVQLQLKLESDFLCVRSKKITDKMDKFSLSRIFRRSGKERDVKDECKNKTFSLPLVHS